MFRDVEASSWRPPVDAPRLDAALARGTLACVVVESIDGETVHATVLPWPQVDRHDHAHAFVRRGLHPPQGSG